VNLIADSSEKVSPNFVEKQADYSSRKAAIGSIRIARMAGR
jgi:hypothetical protein